MQFDSIQAFFSMGGYGAYVFSVYALGVATIAWNLVSPLLQLRRIARQSQPRDEEVI